MAPKLNHHRCPRRPLALEWVPGWPPQWWAIGRREHPPSRQRRRRSRARGRVPGRSSHAVLHPRTPYTSKQARDATGYPLRPAVVRQQTMNDWLSVTHAFSISLQQLSCRWPYYQPSRSSSAAVRDTDRRRRQDTWLSVGGTGSAKPDAPRTLVHRSPVRRAPGNYERISLFASSTGFHRPTYSAINMSQSSTGAVKSVLRTWLLSMSNCSNWMEHFSRSA
jgi:hypothetical protein